MSLDMAIPDERYVMCRISPGKIDLKWEKKGKALEITGLALAPGEWTGMDKIPTIYDWPFIEKLMKTAVGKPIKVRHPPGSSLVGIDRDVVGFTTDYAIRKESVEFNGGGYIKGLVMQPRVVAAMEAGNLKPGLSIEAAVKVAKLDGGKKEQAIDGEMTGIALVGDPACEPCGVIQVRPIKMEKKKMSEEPKEPPTGEEQPPSEPATPPTEGNKKQTAPVKKVTPVFPAPTPGELKKRTTKKGEDGTETTEEEFFPKEQHAAATNPILLQSPCDCGDRIAELEKKNTTLEAKILASEKQWNDTFKTLEKNMNEVNEAKLAALVSDVVKIDPEFKIENLVSEKTSLTERIVFAQKYLSRMASIRKHVTEEPRKLEAQQVSQDQVKKMELAKKMLTPEMFKATYPDAEKILSPATTPASNSGGSK